MSRDIKMHQILRDVKVLDRGQTAGERMKQEFVRTKEARGAACDRETSESIVYAQDQITSVTKKLVSSGSRQVIKQGEKILRNAQQRRKARDWKGHHNLKSTQKGKTIKAGGKSIKNGGQTVQLLTKKTTAATRRAAYAARNSGQTVVVMTKTAAKAAVVVTKSAIAGMKAFAEAIMAGGWTALLLLIVIIFLGAAVNLVGGDEGAYTSVSKEVEAYTPLIRKYAKKYGIGDYVDLIKAVMMQESGGRGNDPMKASACPYNIEYAGGITDPEYSINVGIQYLAACLTEAEVESPIDMEHIKLALQGYNYGNGYIPWAKEKYGGYSAANAVEFSKMMAERLERNNYGDQQYAAHVLQYYPYGRMIPAGGSLALVETALSQEGNSGGEIYWRWYGFQSYQPWCACFVSWCADQCGYIEAGIIPKFSLCSSGVKWFQERGRFQEGGSIPTVGNLIFFDWENNGTIDHVGIVVSVENGQVNTVEGNSSDKVRQRQYSVKHAAIYGYGIF